MLSTLSRRTSTGARGLLVAKRNHWNVSLPQIAGPGGAHITKYNIVKPGKDGVNYDDFLLALPEKNHLASMSKDVPLFVRYLKTVTDKEGRGEAFDAFVERAKTGLVVESSAYISTDELATVMWKNGYTDEERTAIQSTFPSDYHFHYPELAVLFDLSEEDAYKFCMRTRIETSTIGELDFEKTRRQGWLRDHWIIFGTGIFIFKFFPFFNYYFGVKVFGTSMWCYTVWTGLSRFVSKSSRRNEYMAAQKTAQDVMDGEDSIRESMKRFENDTKCVEYLKSFKSDTETKIASYQGALVAKMQSDLNERAVAQLRAISNFEAGMGSAIQELVVSEAAASFKEEYPKNPDMQKKAFAASLKSLSGETLAPGDDPVGSHFEKAFSSLQGVDLMSIQGDASGSLAERVAYAQQTREKQFQESFMVTAAEADEVKTIGAKAKTDDGFDFSKLDGAAVDRLNSLYTSINAKVGYSLPSSVGSGKINTGSDGAEYTASVNSKLATTLKQIQNARLAAFVKAFA